MSLPTSRSMSGDTGRKDPPKCETCDGSGKCQWCFGGRMLQNADDDDFDECPDCDKGKCPDCGGSGRKDTTKI